MKKKLILFVVIFLACLVSPKASALNSVEQKTDLDLDTKSNFVVNYFKEESLLNSNLSPMTNENGSFNLAQAATPTIKIDAGVKKDEILLDPTQEGIEEAVVDDTPTFIERITKEEHRQGPLQLFNKDGHEFKSGPIKNLRCSFFYQGTNTLTWPYQDRVTSKWKDGAAEVAVIGKFRDNKTGFRFAYNFLRDIDDHPSGFMERMSELGLTHEFNKNNQIHVGQTWRLPIGVDGYISTYNQDLPTKSLIGRTFSDTRSFGVRNIGKYKYADYDIGLYDSTRYWADFGNGMDFTGWINLKPLANLDSKKYGKLTLGTGISTGKNLYAYSVYGGYVGYDYKRLHNHLEYSHANGYNSSSTQSANIAEGFYNTTVFDVTDKLKLIGRYDYFNPNITKTNNKISEYTGGLSYDLRHNIKLVGAYTYRFVENGTYSNIISLQARVRI